MMTTPSQPSIYGYPGINTLAIASESRGMDDAARVTRSARHSRL